ncbi:MAG: SAM-dependent DNA methyltransferase [Planctomycetes bacterium]|nr:SAM-dependent DNA methyltransferase [Planctomycetota bacterium]MBL7039289.1 SAM-dependent DNA methyltransferase [Pirellulaceae bacterium]
MASVVTIQKKLGAYYTPEEVTTTLVRWVVRNETDWLLDPACGDGRFLANHQNTFGVECDCSGAVSAVERAPHATVYVGDFFTWAEETTARFDCAAGNPPFIRYQHFRGDLRENALRVCSKIGVRFSGLASSWAPFLAVTASLLKSAGRMAFVVPAEIGHAPYAVPLIKYLKNHFTRVQIVAIRDKVFPDLSEDVWILFADGFGGRTNEILFSERQRFPTSAVPPRGRRVTDGEWTRWNCRLRPMLLSSGVRQLYQAMVESNEAVRFRAVARVGIGYVTGSNDFFHLRPSEASIWEIPSKCLLPTVRNARSLPPIVLDGKTIQHWRSRNEPYLLLRLTRGDSLPAPVRDYLDSPPGIEARAAYKCRHRRPWYVVPDVRIPHAFLSYMSGKTPQLAENKARCSCTNSVHAVEMINGWRTSTLRKVWQHPLAHLSCELEGHPLGGGMLKLEPGEAANIVLPLPRLSLGQSDLNLIHDGISTMQVWRHYE